MPPKVMCKCGKREKDFLGASFNVFECDECRADFVSLRPEFASFTDAEWEEHLARQKAEWDVKNAVMLTEMIQ